MSTLKRIQEITISPVLTYISETRKWNEAEQSEVRTAEMYLRAARGMTRVDREK